MPKSLVPICVLLFANSVLGCTHQLERTVELGNKGRGAEAFASHLVKPLYPAPSIARGDSGLTVVEIFVTKSGHVEAAKVLQSPDDEIADAALHAARASEFAIPHSPNEFLPGHGKLYFYFKLKPTPHVSVPGDQDLGVI